MKNLTDHCILKTDIIQHLFIPIIYAFLVRSLFYVHWANGPEILVYDVYYYANVTQVVLLQLPYGAVKPASEEGIVFPKKIAYGPEGIPLYLYAQTDLKDKFNEPVHGFSLSDKWIEKMKLPAGLDDNMQLFSLKRDSFSISQEELRHDSYNLDKYYATFVDNHEYSGKRVGL